MTERVVGVDDGESRVIPGESCSFSSSVPKGLSQQEVVVFDFGVEGIWGNVENSLSTFEVEQPSICRGVGCLPAWVIIACEERVI